MILEKVPEVRHLTDDEKWELIQELWRELQPLPDAPPNPKIVALLESRMAEYEDNPTSASAWPEVNARLRAAAAARRHV